MAPGSTSPGSLQRLRRSGCPGEKVPCNEGQKVDKSHGVCSPTGKFCPVSRRPGRCEGSQESAGQTQKLDRAAGNREELCVCLFLQVCCCRGEVLGCHPANSHHRDKHLN